MDIKRYVNVLYKLLTNKDYRFLILASQGFYDNMDDEEYLKRMYKACMGKELNLSSPKTFNEKLQCLKLHDRKPEYTMMVDKYAVRKYIADTIGEEYLIPLLGVWDNPDDIDFAALPNQFVLKCNHNSGLGMCICKDKSKLDIDKVKAELRKGLQQDYYLTNREWPYENVARKIIAEKFMEDDNDNADLGLIDYKFFCFNGTPKFAYVAQGAAKAYKSKINMMDLEWKLMPFQRTDHPQFEEVPDKPVNFQKMVELSKILAKNIPFVRVDFYEINSKLFFGELTFFPGSGYIPFEPEEWDYKLGDWLELPRN